LATGPLCDRSQEPASLVATQVMTSSSSPITGQTSATLSMPSVYTPTAAQLAILTQGLTAGPQPISSGNQTASAAGQTLGNIPGTTGQTSTGSSVLATQLAPGNVGLQLNTTADPLQPTMMVSTVTTVASTPINREEDSQYSTSAPPAGGPTGIGPSAQIFIPGPPIPIPLQPAAMAAVQTVGTDPATDAGLQQASTTSSRSHASGGNASRQTLLLPLNGIGLGASPGPQDPKPQKPKGRGRGKGKR
jgi:hypothetical protein